MAKRTPRTINLALQGGGSHGAYTWGALDRLLEEDALTIEGITGASAGAMNAVAMASGYAKNGREGAKAELEALWRKISQQNSMSPVQRSPLDVLLGNWNIGGSPGYLGLDAFSKIASPYQFNPLGLNPLRDMIDGLVDFKAMRKCHALKLFISATNVRTGKVRVFERKEISADVLAASACLPTLFQAIKIGRDYYWDGGYMGNPVLYPLIYECEARDILIVQLNPITRETLPKTAPQIGDRINEIVFNASLMREMRAMAFVTKLLDEGSLDPKKYKKMLIHRIHSEAYMDKLDAASKVNAEWDFLQDMRQAGHKAASRWLKDNWLKIGKKSSVNVRETYL